MTRTTRNVIFVLSGPSRRRGMGGKNGYWSPGSRTPRSSCLTSQRGNSVPSSA